MPITKYQEITQVLTRTNAIAIVGLSPKPDRPPALSDLGGGGTRVVDIVDVLSNSEENTFRSCQ